MSTIDSNSLFLSFSSFKCDCSFLFFLQPYQLYETVKRDFSLEKKHNYFSFSYLFPFIFRMLNITILFKTLLKKDVTIY